MKWKIGDIAGIGVYLHWSFWILPALILFSTLSSGGGWLTALLSVAFIFAVFGCVVLHEVGHALMARRYGIGTRDITLYPIGGVATLQRMSTRPSQELAIALAGPAVNVLIAGVLFLLVALAGIVPQGSLLSLAGGSFLVSLMWVNVALVLFNLLPAFPMDGGRVLRAFLAMQLPHLKATTIAARTGQAVAVVLALIGIFTGGLLLFVALFVFLAAQAELTMARRQSIGWNPAPAAEPLRPGPADIFYEGENDSGIVWLSDVDTRPERDRVVRIVTRFPARG